MNLRPPGYELCFKVRFRRFGHFQKLYCLVRTAFPPFLPRCLHCVFPVLGQLMGQTEVGGQECGQGLHGLYHRLQRGLQRFFIQILMVYRRFCSFSFALRHSLKPVFPCAPRLSVAVYVVRMIIATKEALHMNSETLCSSLAFRLCSSPF